MFLGYKTISDQLTLLAEALSTVPPDERDAVILHYYENESVDHIAYIMGASKEQVEALLSRGSKKIKAYI